MATSKARIRLRGRFPANTKVELHDRLSDSFSPGQLGSAVSKGTTDKQGEISFDGLEAGDRYWVTDGNRGVAVTAKDPPQAKPASKGLASAAPGEDTSQNVKLVTGARSTTDRKPAPGFGHDAIGNPTPTDEREDEPLPAVRQEDVQGVPQRSDTITGEAHPRPKDEPQPAPRQEDVPKGAQQRSDTETGEATVIPKDEVDVSPSLPQEDAKGKQRSDTETGEATPKPVEEPQATPSGERATAKTPASSATAQKSKRAKKTSTAKKGKK